MNDGTIMLTDMSGEFEMTMERDNPTIDEFAVHEVLVRAHVIASLIDDILMFHPVVEQDADLALRMDAALTPNVEVSGG